MKAIKFFKEEGDHLRPAYYSINDAHEGADHPNRLSKLGVKQTFKHDPAGLGRKGFSTMIVRNPDSVSQFLELLMHKKSQPYVVEVEDEWFEPWNTPDTDAEKLYKTIKPLRKLEGFEEGVPPMSASDHAGWNALDEFELKDMTKGMRQNLYRRLRAKGYSFADIQAALNDAHGWEFQNLFGRNPAFMKKIADALAELAADPEMESDRRLKTVLDVQRKY